MLADVSNNSKEKHQIQRKRSIDSLQIQIDSVNKSQLVQVSKPFDLSTSVNPNNSANALNQSSFTRRTARAQSTTNHVEGQDKMLTFSELKFSKNRKGSVDAQNLCTSEEKEPNQHLLSFGQKIQGLPSPEILPIPSKPSDECENLVSQFHLNQNDKRTDNQN